jgi:hypothetical protein
MKTALVSLFVCLSLFCGAAARAQPIAKMMIGQDNGPQAYVLPGGEATPDVPKLGFSGQIIPGLGMRIVYVVPGGLAHSLGMESGDVIRKINGRLINSKFDYDDALIDAVMYHGGHADLWVRNVRYGWTCGAPKYVMVHVDLPTCHIAGNYGNPIYDN